MGQVAIDSKQPPHECERPRVLADISVERDGERLGVYLSHASDDRIARSAEGANVLTIRREHIDDVRRYAPEHAHRQVKPIRSGDWADVCRAQHHPAHLTLPPLA